MTILLPTTTGTGIDYTRTDKAIASFSWQRYHVWVPPGPHPADGRPILIDCQGSGLDTHDPLQQIDSAGGLNDQFLYWAFTQGWVIVSIGQTGKNNPGTGVSVHGWWPEPYAIPNTEWQDPDIFSQEKDIWCGLQHVLTNVLTYRGNAHAVVLFGRSGGAYSALFAGVNRPALLTYTSGDPISLFADFTVLGMIGIQFGSCYLRTMVAGTAPSLFAHWDQQSAPGIPATDVTDANITQLRQASFWYGAMNNSTARAFANLKSYCFLYQVATPPETTNFNTALGTPPAVGNFNFPAMGENQAAGVTDPHTQWNAEMALRYLQAAAAEAGDTTAYAKNKLVANSGGAFAGSFVTDVADTDAAGLVAMQAFVTSMATVPAVEPVAYRIAVDMVETIEAIAPSAGSYYHDVKHAELANRDVFSATEFPTAYVRLVGTSVNRAGQALTNSMVATASYEILGALDQRTDVSLALAWLATDVEQALMVDVTRGDNAVNTRVVDWNIVLPADDEDLRSYLLMQVDVDYRTEHTDLTEAV